MAPPQLLDGLIGGPRQLERDVQAAAALRARAHRGVEGNPGASGVADDGYLLLAGHEKLALADVETVFVLKRYTCIRYVAFSRVLRLWSLFQEVYMVSVYG